MRLRTRISIVGFTLGSCALAALIQFQDNAAFREPEPSELFDTVQSQLRAIRTQHYQQAYLQASSQFIDANDLDRFIESTRASHSAIRQAVRWEFGMISVDEGTADVPVNFFLQNGEFLPATYRLVRENRAWKIDSVNWEDASQARAVPGLRM
jgi:hypothetical protein